MDGDFDYETERLANIRKNEEILAKLGLLDSPLIEQSTSKPKKTKAKRVTSAKKRAADDTDYDDNANESEESDEEPAKKVAKTSRHSLGSRRSSRLQNKPDITYTDDGLQSHVASQVKKVKSSKKSKGKTEMELDDGERPRHRLGVRRHDPKTFGHIPGIPVGKTWELRMHCSTDAVHAPVVSGISGNKHDGAWSIALSGGYEDDIDLGEGFTYTGSGGRDLKGTKQNPKNLRTAPQSKDQSWDHPANAAMKMSCETRKPVRVIRGFKLQSKYAPAEGYRYDGLYIVEKAWMERGLNKEGFKVCKFALKASRTVIFDVLKTLMLSQRLEGQPPIPIRDDDDDDDDDDEDGDEEEAETTGAETDMKTEEAETTDADIDMKTEEGSPEAQSKAVEEDIPSKAAVKDENTSSQVVKDENGSE